MSNFFKFIILFLFSCWGFASLIPQDIPVGELDQVPLDQDKTRYNEVIKKNIELYKNIIKFDVVIKWDDPKINAYSQINDDNWTLVILGGLANHPLMTIDAMAVVLCHELGHLVGDDDRIASQGQANYYATHVCTKKMFAGEDQQNGNAAGKIEAYPKGLCDRVHVEDQDKKICYRTMIASKVSMDIIAGIIDRNPNAKINFDTPDPKVVTRTNINGGGAQCHLDTYMAGALCPLSLKIVGVSDYNDDFSGTVPPPCTEGLGARPRCWFKPID